MSELNMSTKSLLGVMLAMALAGNAIAFAVICKVLHMSGLVLVRETLSMPVLVADRVNRPHLD